MGPAFAFDAKARRALAAIIGNGYADAVLAGNALATHDIEGAYMNTALGQDIYTQENVHSDRGSLSSKGIITNVQDFICNIADGLGIEY